MVNVTGASLLSHFARISQSIGRCHDFTGVFQNSVRSEVGRGRLLLLHKDDGHIISSPHGWKRLSCSWISPVWLLGDLELVYGTVWLDVAVSAFWFISARFRLSLRGGGSGLEKEDRQNPSQQLAHATHCRYPTPRHKLALGSKTEVTKWLAGTGGLELSVASKLWEN